MKAHGKAWSLYVFSSANAIRKYDMRQLVELGVEWIWLGLESAECELHEAEGHRHAGAGARAAVARHPRARLDDHRPRAPHAGEHRRGDRARRRARNGVPPVHALHADAGHAAARAGRRRRGGCSTDVDLADIHGQFKFNFRHAAISRDESKALLDRAFRRDFERNGPEPVPADARHDAAAGGATATTPTRACAARVGVASHAASRGLRRRALGDGAVPASRKPIGQRAGSVAAPRNRARVRRDDVRDQSRRRPRVALVLEARCQAPSLAGGRSSRARSSNDARRRAPGRHEQTRSRAVESPRLAAKRAGQPRRGAAIR